MYAVDEWQAFRTVCPQCKKKFKRTKWWFYKTSKGNNSRMAYFCTWSCLRAWEADHAKKETVRGEQT